MTDLSALWMPILLSAVLVFVASSVIHMASPWHKNDYPRVPNEDQVMDALRPFAIPPGDYMMPRVAKASDMKSPEFLQKVARGPNILFTVMPNAMMNMGSTFVQWFLFSLVVAVFSGYVASRALGAAPSYLEVFRFVGVTAFVSFSAALWPISIWYKRAWSITFKSTVDGLIYAGLMAGAFGWLWPK